MADKDARLAALEAALAHAQRQADELSDEVARQARELVVLERRVGMLLMREAEREAEGGSVALSDPPPPHY